MTGDITVKNVIAQPNPSTPFVNEVYSHRKAAILGGGGRGLEEAVWEWGANAFSRILWQYVNF